MKKRILFWATTRVGKTTFLATALYGNSPELARISRESPRGSINQHLFDVWYRLHHNQWSQPTSADWTGIVLTTGAGAEIELIDIRGGLALEIQNPATRELLRYPRHGDQARTPDHPVEHPLVRARPRYEYPAAVRGPRDLPKAVLQSPALDDRHVYVGCRDGQCYAIDRSGGDMVWSRSFGS